MNIKKFLSFKEAKDYLKVSSSHLYKMTANKEITHFKPSGKLIYFKIDDLDNWLQKNKVVSQDDLNKEMGGQNG